MEDFKIDTICPHSDFCGGCIHQGVPYEKQLSEKEKEVRRLLEANQVMPDRIDPIEGCPSRYGYRNKMEYTFGDFVKDGEMTLGMHRKKNFMSIVTVDQCQLVDPDFNVILAAVLEFCRERGYSFYHKKSHQGLMRNLILRKGVRTGEILVNIVTSSEPGFVEEEFVSMLQGLSLQNTLVGVLRTFNDSLADAVICQKLKVLWGRDYYVEKILGLTFHVSAFSFFQTNVEAVERLYSEALALVDSFEGKTAFDLYCGTGTISQVLALRAAKVLGIELVEEAVEAAKENAAANGLANCSFLAGDVFEVLQNVSEKPDVIVVDPPRVGIQPKALDQIISYGVPEIVYISCNPKTMAGNLKYMEYYGYHCRYLKPFDNFPMTKHVECVVLMSRVDK
ncbi:MAG: 23S rRNA (uracil(1939)-C(5))-methyltransferase RlmD [Firmicutes bacterium]|nr:23S rRNA (uracil(1939)-C(5))-methyltransferase RlmD [Bacillota bacterium]MDY5857444.1 23S rRNA (uracil(1939)-C(5))-methyltransferase RlmD [Anaerovoracaceae bacterium]